MGKIVTSSIKKIYKDLVKQVIKDLGEPVYLYYDPEVARCPNCFWDAATGKSKNVYDTSFVTPIVVLGNTIVPVPFLRGRCPVCRGEGSLFSYIPVVMKALVKWQPADSELVRTVAGDEGSNIVRVKASKSYYIKVRDAKYALIDGVRCELVRPPILRGLGKDDQMVVAFFQAVEVGKSTKDR